MSSSCSRWARVCVAACGGVGGDAVEQVAVTEQVEYTVEGGGVELARW